MKIEYQWMKILNDNYRNEYYIEIIKKSIHMHWNINHI